MNFRHCWSPPDSGHTDFFHDHKPRAFETIVLQLSSILLANHPRHPRPLIFLPSSLKPSDYEGAYKGGRASSLQVPSPSARSFMIHANHMWYSETLKGGSIGGAAGLALGFGGVFAAGARYPAFRHLTLPLKAFLVTSSATFGGMCTLSDPRSSLSTQYEDTAVRSMLGLPESGRGFGALAKPAAFFLSSTATQSANMCFFYSNRNSRPLFPLF